MNIVPNMTTLLIDVCLKYKQGIFSIKVHSNNNNNNNNNKITYLIWT